METSTIKALIFDFDGLILNTETSGFRIWAKIYEEHGCHLELSLYASRIGANNHHFDPFRHLQQQYERPLDRTHVTDSWARQSLNNILTLPVMPGVESYLAEAKQMGLKIGMASGSPHEWVDTHLDRLGLSDYFDCIKCSDDVPNSKPAPDLYDAVLSEFAISPSRIVAFEDSPHGVLAAKRVGIHCVAVPNFVTSQLTFEQADLVLNSLAELPLKNVIGVLSSD